MMAAIVCVFPPSARTGPGYNARDHEPGRSGDQEYLIEKNGSYYPDFL
jgi:hypothetical protein